MSSSLPADYRPPESPALGTGPKDPAPTKDYGFSHTMIRIKDPRVSLPYYIDQLGMTLVHRMDSEGGKFTNYFLLYPQSAVPSDEKERYRWMWSQQGIVELCHNWGTESDASFAGYKSGNEAEHKGFGHLCIFVDDLQKAVDRWTAAGMRFKKRPEEGSMRHIAFLLDPDNYWIEVICKGGRNL